MMLQLHDDPLHEGLDGCQLGKYDSGFMGQLQAVNTHLKVDVKGADVQQGKDTWQS